MFTTINNSKYKQESLANAKVSARQPWYIGRNSLNRPSVRNAKQYQRHLYITCKVFSVRNNSTADNARLSSTATQGWKMASKKPTFCRFLKKKTLKTSKVTNVGLGVLGFIFGEIFYRSYLILYFNCDL